MEEMLVEEKVVETKIVRVPMEGLEEEYSSAVEKKANLRAILEQKLEEEFASKSEVYDKIIALTSYEEEIVVEVPEAEEETPVEE